MRSCLKIIEKPASVEILQRLRNPLAQGILIFRHLYSQSLHKICNIIHVTQIMEQLKNPFVIYGYKGAEYFYDRKKRD